MSEESELPRLVAASRNGDEDAFRQLVALTYHQLRRIGRAQIRKSSPVGMETTMLVHEAFIKMATGSGVHADDEDHFYAIAARAMRQLVVDEARARLTHKRGSGDQPLPLKTSIHLVAGADESVLRLHEALQRLESIEPELSRLVELRVFVGQTEAEAAATLDLPLRTLQRRWRQAKAWLLVALAEE